MADGGNNGLGRELVSPFDAPTISVAGQLDEDTTDLELAAGYTIYKVKINNLNGITGNSMTPFNIPVDGLYRDGFTSIADINLDQKLDVIVSSPGISGLGLVYVYTFNEHKFKYWNSSY